ncbi:MAG TPA: FtsX-like permease family protein [Amycolatopsis sp.]|nr:FtsX-like permease family protein [Amycolatopsis sp.]
MSAWSHAAVTQIRLAFAQARADAGRMIASAIAVALGAAFVVAAFGITATSERAVLNSLAQQYSSTAVVVGADGDAAVPADACQKALTRLRSGGLVGAAVIDYGGAVAIAPAGQAFDTDNSLPLSSISPAGPLRWERVLAGRLPARPGEVAVSGPSSLSVGDSVLAQGVAYGNVSDQAAGAAYPLRVVGVVDIQADPRSGTGARLYTTARQAQLLGAAPGQLRLAAGAGMSEAATLDRARRLLSATPATAALPVVSGEQAAKTIMDGYTGDTAGVTAALLVFVALALLTAAMVIANTFAVVLAQRVRELGLLRCVGATAKQIRRSTLAEAAVLGSISSTLGALLGVGLTVLVAVAFGRGVPEVPLGAPVIPISAPATAILAGTAVTLVASLVPIRAAARVKPLAALHPLDSAADADTSLSRLLLWGVLGLLSLVGLFVTAAADQLAIAVIVGVFNFCTLALLVRLGASRLTAAAGRLLNRLGGISARLATENLRRHPRRTGASVVALLVGVTLTCAVLVGVSAARATATDSLVDAYPFDVTVTAGSTGFPQDIRQRIQGLHGVDAVTPLTSGHLRVGGHEIDAVGIDVDTVSQVSRTDQSVDLPSPGHVAMSYETADELNAGDGTTVRLSGDKSDLTLAVSIAQVPGLAAGDIALDQTDLNTLSGRTSITRLWVRLSGDSPSDQTQADLSAIAKTAGSASRGAEVTANISTRQTLDSVLNFLLTVVLGLLAVTGLIAILGLGNTLALSAIERSQESAMMRALGATRRQLAATVVWEAIQQSVVATALGSVLGIVYGLVGVRAVLYGVRIDVPWPRLALLGSFAVLAGVIAALLPAWRTTGGALMDRIAATH